VQYSCTSTLYNARGAGHLAAQPGQVKAVRARIIFQRRLHERQDCVVKQALCRVLVLSFACLPVLPGLLLFFVRVRCIGKVLFPAAVSACPLLVHHQFCHCLLTLLATLTEARADDKCPSLCPESILF